MSYRIEPLSNDNAYEYAYVNSRAWLESYRGLIDDEYLERINSEENLKAYEAKLKDYVLNDPDHFYLLRVDGKALGVLCIGKSRYQDYKDCGELAAIYLLNEAKGKGYGKILFEYAIKELKKKGYAKMVNGCIEGNPANEFYKHMGGKLVKQVPITIKGNGPQLIENVYHYQNI